jgi:two-component system, NarL family, nitrate/nitrite response regulator NarL
MGVVECTRPNRSYIRAGEWFWGEVVTAVAKRSDGSLRENGEAAPSTISVCLVADVVLHREGLRRLLEAEDRIRLIGVAATEEDVVIKLGDQRPDVVLVDMSHVRARSLAAALRQAAPDVKLVAILGSEVEEVVIPYAEAGFCGYVQPDASAGELVCILERAADDGFVCSAKVASSLIRHVAMAASRQSPPAAVLTPRERQIVELLAAGSSNREIGTELVIEVSTVKAHVHSILGKLGVRRRAQAAAFVRELRGSWPQNATRSTGR